MTAQFPALMEFLDNRGLPTGGTGLFHTGFRHAQVGPGDDEDLAYFDLRTLQTMPRVSGPGKAEIADKRGRLHDIYKLQQKLDQRRGISYSSYANPSAANKLLGGN